MSICFSGLTTQQKMERVVIQPKVTMYLNTDACRCDDFIVLPKTTELKDVIQRCIDAGCYGFSRGSNTQGRGKFYIRSPHKTTTLLNAKLLPNQNVSFFVLEY